MKLDIDLLRDEYSRKADELGFLSDTVKFILQKELSRNKIKIHSFVHRIKSFDSVLDKIQRKKFMEPFKEIHDLVGLRIVCLFLLDLELIGNIIQREFDVFEEDNKIDNTELDVFGYMSLHYKAKLKANINFSGLNTVKDIPFEIQVRTIAQDAWASISHYLDYKQESLLSDKLKRDFYALSGLFYVADTHFSILKQEQFKFLVEKILKQDSSTTNHCINII